MADDTRPAKRIKTEIEGLGQPKNTKVQTDGIDTNQGQQGIRSSGKQGERHHKQSSSKRKNGHKAHASTESKHQRNSIRTFTQPSAMCAGDKGIFMTCDKGCEKKALLELHDILHEYLESRGIDASGESTLKKPPDQGAMDKLEDPEEHSHGSIEADIASELAEMRGKGELNTDKKSALVTKPVQMITLDIPCVSFLRLPSKSSLDPVDIVHVLCSEAVRPESKQRSRYVRRLTPVSCLAKTLRQGLETVSEAVLPPHFGPDEKGEIKSVKFAIRPTVRENEQLDRDLIIKPVANRVQELGKNSHKVDLKHYDKAVVVEVYRGWIGMCVVDNTSTGGYEQGYEELKRFNLAEIYASR